MPFQDSVLGPEEGRAELVARADVQSDSDSGLGLELASGQRIPSTPQAQALTQLDPQLFSLTRGRGRLVALPEAQARVEPDAAPCPSPA